MSGTSAGAAQGGIGMGTAAGRISTPARWATALPSRAAGRTSMAETQAASAWLSSGTSTLRTPAWRTAATRAITPLMGRTAPSSPSSPTSAVSRSREASGSWPDAARIPTAIARS